ncbi:GatB/YqeY domain-containing protein [Candidatus Persebacteraceae bacterium Df01]|uniref:GatB/YqeY domain-containing protein n=1 Tax=Candidatus Doriopsillibacter californiensis TaxID=2970740 RepID=A0ABT7QKG2_9GAMM|nr:GatB/YqeY domain-containing protein [Candidatus Persebacteraceae bacterium Df01]
MSASSDSTAPPTPAQRLQKEVQVAMKAGDQLRVDVFRMLLAAVKKTEIDSGKPVEESDFVAVTQKLIKQRRESATQYGSAGRDELAAREREEITILEPFLPPQLDEKELEQAVEAAITNCGASSMRDMGKVMGQLKNTLVGADMSIISRLLKQKLTN